jgi:hypothetical protein
MIDLFDTRTMLDVLDQRTPPRSFLRSTFFGKVKTSLSKSVDIDVIKHKRRLAPFVSPKMEGKVVQREGFKTYTYSPAYIKEKMVTEAKSSSSARPGKPCTAPTTGRCNVPPRSWAKTSPTWKT